MNRLQFLLSKLSEEASEVAQMCSKSSIYGLEHSKPRTEVTNKDRLIDELNDLLAIVYMLESEFFETQVEDTEKLNAKYEKVEKYYKICQELGTVKRIQDEY